MKGNNFLVVLFLFKNDLNYSQLFQYRRILIRKRLNLFITLLYIIVTLLSIKGQDVNCEV